MITAAALAHYLQLCDQARAERVSTRLRALTDREQTLVREASVMGYVQGMQAAEVGVTTIPGDQEIVARVVEGCIAMSDLYQVLGQRREENEEDQ